MYLRLTMLVLCKYILAACALENVPDLARLFAVQVLVGVLAGRSRVLGVLEN